MPDRSKGPDPGAIWRDQPEERPVELEQIVSRRTQELSVRTRSEILISLASTVLLAAVVAWRMGIGDDRLLGFGLAAAGVWLAISLYSFGSRIFPNWGRRPDAVAATCLEYYRQELERRRNHLRNAWLWHGPLVLAVLILIAVFTGTASPALRQAGRVMPLLVLLAAWVGFGIWRRHLQARSLEREIDELARAESLRCDE